MQKKFQMLQYLPATNSINIIEGDFNYDVLKVSENKLLDNFTDHVEMVNRQTHISGPLIDHFYIHEKVDGTIFTNTTVKSNFFSDYDP